MKGFLSQNKKVGLLILIVIIATISISAGFYMNRTNTPPTILSANGTIEANLITLSSQQPGPILSVYAEEGDNVTKGQALADIDCAKLKTRITAIQAKIKETQLNLNSTDKFLSSQESIATIEGRVANQPSQSQINTNIIATRGFRNSLAQELTAGKAQEKELQLNLKECYIKSPIAGQILYRLIEPGELINIGTRLFVLQDPNSMYMTVYLPTQDVGKIKLQSNARIYFDALPQQYVDAKVTFIAAKAEFTPKQVQTTQTRQDLVFRVKLHLIDVPVDLIKPGMPGTAYINLASTWPPNWKP